MERGDLLEANGAIFTAQGKALNEVAADDVRIGVTGNPANTNALIALSNAPDIPQERFTALTRLDHNRALSQLAAKTGATVADIKKLTIWGNHSATQYPDIFHAEVGGKNAAEVVDDQAWIENDFIPTVAKRGAAIIEARGSSSAASAASATIDAARDWLHGSPEGDWVSMAVGSDGLVRRPRGPRLLLPRHHQGRRLGDRPGPRDRRLLARPHGRHRRRARRGARRGQGPRPDLSRRPLREARRGPEDKSDLPPFGAQVTGASAPIERRAPRCRPSLARARRPRRPAGRGGALGDRRGCRGRGPAGRPLGRRDRPRRGGLRAGCGSGTSRPPRHLVDLRPGARHHATCSSRCRRDLPSSSRLDLGAVGGQARRTGRHPAAGPRRRPGLDRRPGRGRRLAGRGPLDRAVLRRARGRRALAAPGVGHRPGPGGRATTSRPSTVSRPPPRCRWRPTCRSGSGRWPRTTGRRSTPPCSARRRGHGDERPEHRHRCDSITAVAARTLAAGMAAGKPVRLAVETNNLGADARR